VGDATLRVCVQPPVQARPDRLDEAAAQRVHGRGQGGGQERARLRPALPAGRRRVRRARRLRAGAASAGAGRCEAARRGDLAGDRAGGHPVGHAAARSLQEGPVPHRDAGAGADGADRAAQRRRGDVARSPGAEPRDGRSRRAARRRYEALERGDGRRPRRRGPPDVPGHPRRVAWRGRRRSREAAVAAARCGRAKARFRRRGRSTPGEEQAVLRARCAARSAPGKGRGRESVRRRDPGS